ncbi:aminotransferase class I/II-fold pyridoxal phosphate-dependent enzyme [Lactobacillus iners]|uniref:aminotransferase class I/II-fold pyridoxal phosphate-dependent enzyme n=1 Tax=Lactobacillus iners TaxID=147802 RepID=UPI002550C500|nr:aminotransferase class I/II-fold pyridoxal phosphate-dependent enzyme [Lactobacillus iners]MDK7108861.1 aminotransferase class I/II-fold pyridoxal phosphate-dependent enzyme [Lactobacillus iners]
MSKLSENVHSTLNQIPKFKLFNFSQYALKFPDVIQLTLGEPDFNTPDHIKLAAIKAIINNHTRYAPQRGIPALLNAISADVEQKLGLHYDPKDEIIVTNGVTEGCYATIMALANPGDIFLLPTPGFPMYVADVAIAGAEIVEIDISKDNFKLTPRLLQKYLDKYGDRVKGLIMVNPSNPTGVAMNQAELDALADVIRGKNIFVISDEIYNCLWYEDEIGSIAKALPEQTIMFNGFSKTYCMTGWRIGYICAPREISAQIFKVHCFALTDTVTFVQDAAIEALVNGQDDCLPMKKAYIERRDYICDALAKMGWEHPFPQGAFYVFAKAPEFLEQDDEKLAYDLINNAKIAVAPGSYFGKGGEHYLRFSYAISLNDIKIAMERLKKYTAERKLQ